MSKIVVAANAMIEHKNKISNVVPGWNSSEIFFVFDGKYKWSIFKRSDGHYSLMYYPGAQKLEFLAGLEDQEWAEFSDFVTYSSKDISTRESIETFKELFGVVSDLRFGMDDVLDDIINSFEF